MFRDFLLSQNFTEIHTPKIISAASEGDFPSFGGRTTRKGLSAAASVARRPPEQGEVYELAEVPHKWQARPLSARMHAHDIIRRPYRVFTVPEESLVSPPPPEARLGEYLHTYGSQADEQDR